MKKFEGKYELTSWINDMKWHCLQLSHGVNYKSYLLFLNSHKSDPYIAQNHKEHFKGYLIFIKKKVYFLYMEIILCP